ncbi:MAG TPA: 16S rRNA (adenine(1518)-N(6)/adenine(1519)-N(6))-dimethyltransferase RsmA [bacterium]|nr:16S rRNA (adenine(1518)-N(6)/adenine(1519)-N(6))-dimethyltransferase RsmA [bacterium]
MTRQLPSVHSLLKKYGIAPKKRLGQHFLHARPVMEKIVAALAPEKKDAVIEIGPGLGVMTAIAAAKADHVFAIEKDAAMIDAARAEFGDIENITWIEEDILEVPLCDVVRKLALIDPDERALLMGNLPYNISSPIFFCMLEHRKMLARAVVMVQREVAERVCAKPGGKDYGILSVLMQAVAECKKLFDVTQKSFVPPPEVVSSVMKLEFRTGGCGIEDEAFFRVVVKGAFGQRRKTLRNALLGARLPGIGAERLDSALSSLKIDPKRRPETLSVEEFINLSNKLLKT